MAAAILAVFGVCSNLVIVAPAEAQVSCVPAFSYTSGLDLFEKSNCGTDTHLVMANTGGESRLSPNEQYVATWQNIYQGHATVKAVDGSSAVDLGMGGDLAWSPDSSALALPGRSAAGESTIDVVSRDGTDRHSIVTDPSGSDMYPTWSPDGSRIATVHLDSNTQRYSLWMQGSANGANRRQVFEAAQGGGIDAPPAWTPDGNYLVFSFYSASNNRALYVASVSGGSAVQLPTVSNGQPWAPTIARDWSLGYVITDPAPHFVVQTINDPAGAVHFAYENSTSTFEFRPQGTVTAPPPNWPPAGVGGPMPPPPPSGGTGARVTSVASTITATTPRWNLDLSVGLQNVACPAKVKITLGTWTKTVNACDVGQTAPTTLHYLWKVFDANHSLPPKSTVPVTAFVVGSKAQPYGGSSATMSLPDAPLIGGLGDSYSSGHHQDRDNIDCLPQANCTPDSLLPNDLDFSWVSRMAVKINKNVPAEWRYRVLLEAQSGATTRQMFEQGQVDRVMSAVAARGKTWSVISFTGGANNLNFVGVLADFYKKFFPLQLVKPWNVKKWSDCPDTQTLYSRYLAEQDMIRADLAQIVARGRAASPSVRFLDMMYPYPLKSDNVCAVDRRIPDPNNLSHSITWHGAAGVIDGLDSLHLELNGPDIHHVDLRQRFGPNPLPETQQTRFFGFPHPDDSGQNQMATAAVAALP